MFIVALIFFPFTAIHTLWGYSDSRFFTEVMLIFGWRYLVMLALFAVFFL
jgi:hypothetical protein